MTLPSPAESAHQHQHNSDSNKEAFFEEFIHYIKTFNTDKILSILNQTNNDEEVKDILLNCKSASYNFNCTQLVALQYGQEDLLKIFLDRAASLGIVRNILERTDNNFKMSIVMHLIFSDSKSYFNQIRICLAFCENEEHCKSYLHDLKNPKGKNAITLAAASKNQELVCLLSSYDCWAQCRLYHTPKKQEVKVASNTTSNNVVISEEKKEEHDQPQQEQQLSEKQKKILALQSLSKEELIAKVLELEEKLNGEMK